MATRLIAALTGLRSLRYTVAGAFRAGLRTVASIHRSAMKECNAEGDFAEIRGRTRNRDLFPVLQPGPGNAPPQAQIVSHFHHQQTANLMEEPAGGWR